uniref:Uncharacterized protein n=1 Tax=Dunaliella tertiolecta TaxID=3047 RepID=A0A7S3QRX4_DUNTE
MMSYLQGHEGMLRAKRSKRTQCFVSNGSSLQGHKSKLRATRSKHTQFFVSTRSLLQGHESMLRANREKTQCCVGIRRARNESIIEQTQAFACIVVGLLPHASILNPYSIVTNC